MLIEIKPERPRKENRTDLILLATFIILILLTICVLSVILLSSRMKPRPTPQESVPVKSIPTASLPTAIPANPSLIRLPIFLTGTGTVSVSVSVPEQIWKVTKIKIRGFELDGKRYDVAIFQRVGSENTVKAYCINRGWDTPDVGTEYLLIEGGIYVPLHEPDADPLQRFLKINN